MRIVIFLLTAVLTALAGGQIRRVVTQLLT